jgi:hypothetical protein
MAEGAEGDELDYAYSFDTCYLGPNLLSDGERTIADHRA